MSKPDLSIIILTYKQDGLLKNCLKSLYEHQYQKNIEVIVVDNHSQDRVEEIVKNNFPQTKFIQTGQNLGHAKGNNIGIKFSSGRHILILNADTHFHKNILDDFVDFMDANPKVGIAGAQLRNPDGSLQPGAWKFPDMFMPAYQRLNVLRKTKSGIKAASDYEISDWDRSTSRTVDWVQGSCMMVRREMVNQIGAFDEDFFLYFTDTEWCHRAWKNGWEVHYNADLPLIHYYHRESALAKGILSAFSKKTTRLHIKDWFIYLKKHWRQLRPEL